MKRKPPRKPARRIMPPDAVWGNNAATYEVLPPPYRGPGPAFTVGPIPCPKYPIIEFEPIEDEPLPFWKSALVSALVSFGIGGALGGVANFRGGSAGGRAGMEASRLKT